MKKYFALILFLLTNISTTYGMWMESETLGPAEMRRAARTKDPIRYYISTELPVNHEQEEQEDKNLILDDINKQKNACTRCRIASAALVATATCAIIITIIILTNVYQ